MQLADPSVLEPSSSGEAAEMAMAAAGAVHQGVNGGGEIIGMESNSGEEKGSSRGDEGDKMNSGGNRWPRQETLALLKIRSDMDAVFRDSSLKGPLWDEVSRKLAELGYHRSAKKCKEKFENVYKYHKRTKETKEGKKTYKFFDQLQALETHQFTISHHNPTKTQLSLPTNRPNDNTTTISYVTTVPSTNPTVISPSAQPAAMNPRSDPPPQNNNNSNIPFSLPNINNLFSSTASTSSSTASDEDLEERYRKKRKWKDYFRRLTRQVLAKQEEMQKKFLDAIDKREQERMAQQEAWRMQQMDRINREHEILVQERTRAAAKDAALIASLQKLSGQQNPTPTAGGNNFLQQLQPPPLQPPPVPVPPPPPLVSEVQVQPPQQPPLTPVSNKFEIQKMNNVENGHSVTPTSSSRWPKSEVHALIRLRTNLEIKYQENGPKAPLWEEISVGMQRLGYNRNAKRCKEKWENINKYFKKMKESNKQRREDSKTCPYFDELDALYREKNKSQNPFGNSFQNMKPNEMMEPLMVQPEQQWRPPPRYEQQPLMEENAKREGEDVDEDDGDSMEEDEEGAGSYEIATNNRLSSADAV